MTAERVFLSTIKEDRGWYFVEYKPPRTGDKFSFLNVVVPGEATPVRVAAAMESELERWLHRYPIPLMVSAFDAKGDVYQLEGTRPINHVVGYLEIRTNRPVIFWRLPPENEIPGNPLSADELLRLYNDVPYKTSAQTRQEAAAHRRQIQIGWAIVIGWVVVVPVAWAIFEWAGPAWVGLLLLPYSLWQAFVKALKLLGKWKVSPRELKAQEEELLMQHHHYHCERNPEGFLRLKLENFEREERERIQEEANALKRKR